ncbi:MAG: Ig-like domain-containing protein [Ardenticatenaceae bacterium]|nr:Ig-like domain-containing protein [Ardenticatenaceae bacterium]
MTNTVQVTADNTPPTGRNFVPAADQQIFTDEEWVIVQAQVADDASLNRVEFYVDGRRCRLPSARCRCLRKWDIPGPGCHSFRVVAIDAAGNVGGGEDTAVSVCLFERE